MSFFNPSAWQQGPRRLPSALPQCGLCGLYKGAETPKMPSVGAGRRKILFVSEAPGEAEDIAGNPFIGKNAGMLRKVLYANRVKLDDCTMTNSIICRPPQGSIERYVECCRPNLLKTIRTVKPNVIVLLGGMAVRSLVPMERDDSVGSINRWVGWNIPSAEHSAWICPTHHPFFLRRSRDAVLDRQFSQHLQKAISLEHVAVTAPKLKDLRDSVQCLKERDAWLRLRKLAQEEGTWAVDYETTGLKPDHPKHRIVSCAFSDGDETFAFLVKPKHRRLLSMVLRSPRILKVAANLKHEERWTISKLGHPVIGWEWDTLLAAHILDNRPNILSLKFQSYVHFGVADYAKNVDRFFQGDEQGFNRIEQVPTQELLVYNGLDSLLEYKLMEKQREEMQV